MSIERGCNYTGGSETICETQREAEDSRTQDIQDISLVVSKKTLNRYKTNKTS